MNYHPHPKVLMYITRAKRKKKARHVPVQERKRSHCVHPTVHLSKPLNSLINRRNAHDLRTKGVHALDLHTAGSLFRDLKSKATYGTGSAQLAQAVVKAQGREQKSKTVVTIMTVGRKRDRKGPKRKDTLIHDQDPGPDLDQGQSPEKEEESEHFHICLPQDQGIEMK